MFFCGFFQNICQISIFLLFPNFFQVLFKFSCSKTHHKTFTDKLSRFLFSSNFIRQTFFLSLKIFNSWFFLLQSFELRRENREFYDESFFYFSDETEDCGLRIFIVFLGDLFTERVEIRVSTRCVGKCHWSFFKLGKCQRISWKNLMKFPRISVRDIFLLFVLEIFHRIFRNFLGSKDQEKKEKRQQKSQLVHSNIIDY